MKITLLISDFQELEASKYYEGSIRGEQVSMRVTKRLDETCVQVMIFDVKGDLFREGFYLAEKNGDEVTLTPR